MGLVGAGGIFDVLADVGLDDDDSWIGSVCGRSGDCSGEYGGEGDNNDNGSAGEALRA